jgi:CheY-like chemotaxis protein
LLVRLSRLNTIGQKQQKSVALAKQVISANAVEVLYIKKIMSISLGARHILLADDDKDDGILFQDILDELPLSTYLTTVSNGEQLMQLLNETKDRLPDVLFLDLNMPRKNGFDCLLEIKHTEKLKLLSVIIFSTSCKPEIVSLLYKNGAQYYIRKPNSYRQLKKLIHQALILTDKTNIEYPLQEKFVLS